MMLSKVSDYIQEIHQKLNGHHVLAIAASVAGTWLAFKATKSYLMSSYMTSKRRQRQRDRKAEEEELSRRVNQCGLSPEKEREILGLTVSQLHEKLQNGDLKAVDVLHAYQRRALKANKEINAITGYIHEAEDLAAECDRIEDRSGRPLHGIPVTIKESIPFGGYDSTAGMSIFLDQKFEEDCVLIKVLKQQGAIPFARTNIPQTMLSMDSCNPIYGQTLNPHKKTHSAGGSTGGEAACLSIGASILGLGGDIGGSIRIPSAFCGTYGLKPAYGRISGKGEMTLFKGQNLVRSCLGPMARDVDGLVLLMKAILCPYQFALDRRMAPIPFQEKMLNEKNKLRIGYYFEDGYMALTPMMKRAVQEAVDALRSLGYEVVEWSFPNLGNITASMASRTLLSDGGALNRRLLKSDAIDHAYNIMYWGQWICQSRIISFLVRNFFNWVYPKMGLVYNHMRGCGSIQDWQHVTRDLAKLKGDVEDDLRSKGIDIVIAPGFTTPAMAIGSHRFVTGTFISTVVYNCLDFPVGSMPVTKVTTADIAKLESYPTPDLWHKRVKKYARDSEGLPLNVQIVGLPFHEERILRVMKDLESALKPWKHAG